MRSAPTQSLRTLAVKSAAWYGGTRLWGQMLSWGVTILLARILVPADYGLFAMGLSVLAVLELLQEFGLGTAIVQRQDLTARQVNAIFWVIAGASLGLAAATFLSANMISRFYAEPRLGWILRALCVTFLLNALGLVPYSLLTKTIDLRHRSLAEALGTTTSALTALTLAHLGHEVWALVIGHLARAVVLNGAMAVFAGWRPGLQTTWEGIGAVLRFGFRMAGTQLFGYLAPVLSTFVLARFLGDAALGLYAMAQSLSEAPHRISTAIINQVSLPVFSRVQADTGVLGGYFLSISKWLAVVSLPVQVGLVLVAPDLIPVLMSEKWQPMVVPFQMFCLESAMVVLTATCAPLLTARGRAQLLLRLSGASLGATLLATLVGVHFGLIGVTVARLIVIVPLRLILLLPSLRELGMPLAKYAGGLATPAAATGAMVVAVAMLQHAWPEAAGTLGRLVLGIGAGALTYPAVLLVLDRKLGSDMKVAARDLFSTSKA